MIEPPTFSTIFNSDSFITSEKITVNTSPNQCPACHKTALWCIPDDPGTGLWFYCSSCRFAGDPIDFIMRVHAQPTPIRALRYMKAQGQLLNDDAATAVNEYNRRKEHDRAIAGIMDAMATQAGYDQASSMLYDFKLYTGYRPTLWKLGMGRMMGFAQRDQLGAIVHMFGGRPSDRYLVMPAYDLPGRMAGLFTVNKNREIEYRSIYRDQRAGFGIYEKGWEHQPCTLAFSDPISAWQVALPWLEANPGQSLPILLWDRNHNPQQRRLPWHRIKTDHLIFWDNLDESLVRACWNVPNARISQHKPEGYLGSYDVISLTASLLAAGKPVLEVLRSELLNRTDLALSLSYTFCSSPAFCTAVKSVCRSKAEVDSMNDLLNVIDVVPDVQSIKLSDGSTVVALADGYWVADQSGDARKRITNFTVSNIQLVRWPRENMLHFDLRIGVNTTPLRVPYAQASQLRRLQRAAGANMLDIPEIYLAGWKNRWLNMCMELHGVKDVPGLARVGWDPRYKHFAFPNFNITKSGAGNSNYFIEDVSACPLADILQPPTLDRIGETGREYWELAGLITGNLLRRCRTNGLSVQSMMYNGPVSRLEVFRNAFGLLSRTPRHGQFTKMETEHPHELPMIIDMTSTGMPVSTIISKLPHLGYGIYVIRPDDRTTPPDMTIAADMKPDSEITVADARNMLALVLHAIMPQTCTTAEHPVVTGLSALRLTLSRAKLKVPQMLTKTEAEWRVKINDNSGHNR